MFSYSRKFLSYYKPYWRLFCLDIICALILSATTLAFPICIRSITKQLQEGFNTITTNHMLVMGGIMLALLVAHVVCRMFVDYQGHMMGAFMERDMRKELFEHYQKLSFNFYDQQRTGQLITRLTTDTLDLSELFHHGPEELAIALLTFVGAFVIMLNINWELALIIFFFLPIMAAYTIYFNRRMNQALRISKDRIGDINAQVEDSLSGIRVVKSFANDAIEREKFDRQNKRFIDSRRSAYRNESYFYAGMTTFTQMLPILVIVVAGLRISQGALDFADLITFLMYISILVEPIHRFINLAHLFQNGITGFSRFMEVLEVRPDIEDKSDAIQLEDVRGEIELCNVSFRYKEGQDAILRNISLHIKPGEYVALVGASGVGKTTLCSLIPRFYEISAGKILLDGKDVRDLRLQSLRQNIGIVQQDIYLFAGSVADNIRYGNLNASFEEIVTAAKKAHAHDFIMALSDGYDTDIGQRGVKLSGGQKQRLSIARVFLKNPPLLIFDEATSALDNSSEKIVQESLENLATDRTTIVIAHRLSTVRNAARIVVMSSEGIVETGSHDELIARNGEYTKLYSGLNLA